LPKHFHPLKEQTGIEHEPSCLVGVVVAEKHGCPEPVILAAVQWRDAEAREESHTRLEPASRHVGPDEMRLGYVAPCLLDLDSLGIHSETSQVTESRDVSIDSIDTSRDIGLSYRSQ
jgi:hypothetical protein